MARSNKLPHPKMTVRQLANLSLLDTLDDGVSLAVYLRLVAATASQHTRTVSITNAELHSQPRRAMTALQRLQCHGLVNVKYDGAVSRTIEVR